MIPVGLCLIILRPLKGFDEDVETQILILGDIYKSLSFHLFKIIYSWKKLNSFQFYIYNSSSLVLHLHYYGNFFLSSLQFEVKKWYKFTIVRDYVYFFGSPMKISLFFILKKKIIKINFTQNIWSKSD